MCPARISSLMKTACPFLLLLLVCHCRAFAALGGGVAAAPCDGCGYNCDAQCNCGRCSEKPGCLSEGQCLGQCNAGNNAKWCGGTSPPAPGPAPSPAPSASWSTSPTSNMLLRDGTPVTLHGIGSTCTEYLLRGIGMQCFTDYNWAMPSELLRIDPVAMQPLISTLSAIAATDVVPAVRIPLTASSWLGIETRASRANMQKYPNLGQQYRNFIMQLVKAYTGNGIVAILDLHWMDDDVEQQPMATKSGNTSALTFWDSIASVFGNNSYCFYELYNEPHTSDVDAYMNGDAETAGMLEMLAQVRKHANSPIIIAGAKAYAYDDESLIQLDHALVQQGETNVLYNFHPYMGPAQAGAANKCPAGFADMAGAVKNATSKPLIITEFGQACCSTHGACEDCPASSTGYDEDVLTTAKSLGMSWLPWAWRPSAGGPNTQTCEDIGVRAGPNAKFPSVLSPGTDGKGADFSKLWSQFAPSSSPGPSPSPPPPPGPSPSGCPGGSLAKCFALCPANPPAVYKACVQECSSRCT